ncbi:large subunit ribosomal protein L18 [Terrimicrobium sacchariphilum]|jgi:large subunit ribosomal protein L18|uniref:Large ribosomal subunit protein uL18 n=1 Tax=Terrimicrobium sacchariphilum TaxID=690879 RepID=A0A146GDS4_TERSA|nr:50S ribosomal protein L18 [Terrimicrobium sacchariphilum]GAT34854.1 large subunit ribosomal protein L18 [Terrimicrobium sacchariphilum]
MAAKQSNKRQLRHVRLRKKVAGTTERPRLAVHFSERHITAQVIDDTIGKTVASVHTTESELRSDKNTRANVETAVKVGKLIAERVSSKSVKKVVFDRGGFKYHGKVKALADAAREAGLEF